MHGRLAAALALRARARPPPRVTRLLHTSPALGGAPASRVASVALNKRIDPKALTVTRTRSPKEKTPNEKLVFGAAMSDHMLEVDWDASVGWHKPAIVPYHPLAIDPAASSLHYGIEVCPHAECPRGTGGCARNGTLLLWAPDFARERGLWRLHFNTNVTTGC